MTLSYIRYMLKPLGLETKFSFSSSFCICTFYFTKFSLSLHFPCSPPQWGPQCPQIISVKVLSPAKNPAALSSRQAFPCLQLVPLVCTWLQGTNNKTTVHAVSIAAGRFTTCLFVFETQIWVEAFLHSAIWKPRQANIAAIFGSWLFSTWPNFSSNVLQRSFGISAGERL